MYFSFIPFFNSRSIKSPSSKVYQKLALIVYLPNFADSLLSHDKGHRLLSLMLLVSNLLQVISFFSSTLHHFFMHVLFSLRIFSTKSHKFHPFGSYHPVHLDLLYPQIPYKTALNTAKYHAF